MIAGARFPRALLASPAAERLLVALGVEIVDELDRDLEAAARAWLADAERNSGRDQVATRLVRRTLDELDRRRRP